MGNEKKDNMWIGTNWKSHRGNPGNRPPLNLPSINCQDGIHCPVHVYASLCSAVYWNLQQHGSKEYTFGVI